MASDPADASLADELASEEMAEIANLTCAQTGVRGTILISTAMGAQGPRVRYFAQPGRTQLSFSVSIGDHPMVTVPTAAGDSLSDRADLLQIAPQVINWMLQNKSALLNFWHHGDSWSQPEVNTFIQQLRRVDMSAEPHLSELHRKSRHNKDWLLKLAICGCYYCLREFAFDQIIKWIETDTALCPFCEIDTCIGLDSEVDRQGLLHAMHDRWFGSAYRFTDDIDVQTPIRG